MFPGCGSAWNTECLSSIVKKTLCTSTTSLCRSIPFSSSDAMSVILMPGMYSMVSTSLEDRSSSTDGTITDDDDAAPLLLPAEDMSLFILLRLSDSAV